MKGLLSLTVAFLCSSCLSSCIDLELYTWHDDVSYPYENSHAVVSCMDTQGGWFVGQITSTISNHYLMIPVVLGGNPFAMPYWCEIDNFDGCCADEYLDPATMGTTISIYMKCGEYDPCDGTPGNPSDRIERSPQS